jgi:hypothetical protein
MPKVAAHDHAVVELDSVSKPYQPVDVDTLPTAEVAKVAHSPVDNRRKQVQLQSIAQRMQTLSVTAAVKGQ